MTDFQILSESCGVIDGYVVTARRFSAGDDPRISIYYALVVRVTSGTIANAWREGFGSLEALKAFLQGLKVVLVAEGYPTPLLGWPIKEEWTEPSGLRWTIQKGEMGEQQELRSDGSVVQYA